MSRKIHYPWDNVLNNGYLSMGLSMGLLCIEGGHLVGGVGEILIKKTVYAELFYSKSTEQPSLKLTAD